LLFIIKLCFSQTATCLNDAQCNTQSTLGANYCQSTVCTPRTTVAFRAIKTSTAQVCTGSYATSSLNILCGQLAQAGCTVAATDAATQIILCVNSTYSITAGGCVTNAVSTNTYTTLLGRCTLPLVSPAILCPMGSVCLNQVCRKQTSLGNFCTQFTECMSGNCNLRTCVIPYSVYDGNPCDNSQACYSGVCQLGICVSAYGNPCYTNDDCNSFETCITGTNANTKSYCTSQLLGANSNYNNCLYNKCVTQYGTNTLDCTNQNCTTPYINLACSTLCNQNPEKQFNVAFGSYTYDCKAITRTLWAATACGNNPTASPQVINCGTNVY